MPSPEQLLELTFPLGGINTGTEFQLQPANTTPIAINVRSIDPIEHRNRGASRCGIRKYVDQKLGLLSLIQHMNIIVDPTIEATLSEADSTSWKWLSESSPLAGPTGRQMRRDAKYMRKGGSGVQHKKSNSNAPRALDDTINISRGDPDSTIQPLANDTYSGAATFAVVGTSPNFIGSYAVSGPIGGWDFTYTPPAAPTDGKARAARTMLVGYTLKATGNKGKAGARIRINLAAFAPGPTEETFGPYDSPQTMAIRYNDDFPFGLGRFSRNGVDTDIIFVSDVDPGPFDPGPGFTGSIVAMPDDGTFDILWQAFADTSPPSPPDNGQVAFNGPGGTFSITTDEGTGPAGPTVRDYVSSDVDAPP